MEEQKNPQQEPAPENTTTTPEEPTVVAGEELKMPEDTFTPSSAAFEPDKSAHLGAILGILIVVLVLILGGLYLWGMTMSTESLLEVENTMERPTAEENNEPESSNAEAEVETMGAVSTSNSIEAIEADIESTDLDALDAELNAIETELDASLGAL